MPDPGSFTNGPDEQKRGPIDFDVLNRVDKYLAGSQRYTTVALQPEYAPHAVVAEYDLGYFPPDVERASLRIRWYQTDDFTIHYSEQHADGSRWECRWDRHPNDHNTRDHFHPPPSAATPGEDTSFPWDWRDVMTLVLKALDARIRSFWK